MKLPVKKVQCILQHKDVMCAYLFGSQAQGTAHASSDIDMAVLLNAATKSKRFEIQLKLFHQLEDIFKTQKIDLIVLNDTESIVMKYSIITEGKLFYEKNAGKRIDFELKTMNEYQDFAPFLEAYNKMYLATV